MRHTQRGIVLAVFLGSVVAAAPAVRAQEPEGDFQQTVARVSLVSGDGSYQRGDDADHWQPLAVNVPMTIGDRVFAGDAGRLQLEAPGFRAFIAPRTELTALNLTEDVQQYSIGEGTASFRVVSMEDDDVFEIDTPNAAITLTRTGLYRVYVDQDGNTRFSVRRGEARVAAGGGEVPLAAGEQIVVNGIDTPEYDVYALPLADSWDRWVDSRERRQHQIASYDYTSPDVVGAGDLDTYGTWEHVPEYGEVWRPAAVEADWAPYRFGNWIWQDPWGWTWVSNEPWGWAPYHYGRWVVVSSRWCWVPVGPSIRHVSYAPALVAFVGGGPGWSVSVGVGGGYVGWFPLAPRDPFVPWWGRAAAPPVVNANATYANRAYATVVERSVFADARPVRAAVVRDANLVRQVEAAPVLRGPLPVLPTRASLRAVATDRPAPRPPEAVVARPVAARLAPPPAPPAFDRKVDVIRQNRGAPVAPAAAASLVASSPQGARAAVAIRPVVREDRRVDLAPRRDAEGAPPADPIHAGGRSLATAQAPFIAHPSGGREPAHVERIAPGAVVTPAPKPTVPEEARRVQGPVAVAPPTPAPQARVESRAVPPPTPAPQARVESRAVVSPSPAPQARVEPQVESRVEPRAYSRPPRRIAEPLPDPLVASPARGREERPAERQEVKPKPEPPKKPEPKRD